MRKGITLIEICVIIAVLGLIVGIFAGFVSIVKKHQAENKVTQWEVTPDLTARKGFYTYILTDPASNQKWLVVRSNGVTVIPYVPTEVKAEKEIK